MSSEVVDTYWKEIVETCSVEENISCEIGAGELERLLGGGGIRIISRSAPFERIIGGVPVLCVRITFVARTTLTIRSVKKFALIKIWFELIKTRCLMFNNQWKPCGKTFEMREIYTRG